LINHHTASTHVNLLTKVFIILLIFPCTILAEKISFKQNFPDPQLRGKSFEVSSSNYSKASSLSQKIYSKEIEINRYMQNLDGSKHPDDEIAGWNKLRTEHWYLIKELRSVINESQK